MLNTIIRTTLINTKDDEFEWQGKIDVFRKEIAGRVTAIEPTKLYYIVTGKEVGTYDFKLQGFPLTVSKGSYFPIRPSDESYRDTNIDISLVFASLDKLGFLPMTPERGKAFTQSRKDKYGDIDRNVTVKITFRFVEPKSKEYKTAATVFGPTDLVLVGKIEKAEVIEESGSVLGELTNLPAKK